MQFYHVSISNSLILYFHNCIKILRNFRVQFMEIERKKVQTMFKIQIENWSLCLKKFFHQISYDYFYVIPYQW